MIVSGQALSIRSAKLEGAVVQCIRDWATAFPDELIAFDQQMKARRASGEYRGEHGSAFLETPVRLDQMLMRRVHRNYRLDPKLLNLVASHFPIGMLRPRDRVKVSNQRESA